MKNSKLMVAANHDFHVSRRTVLLGCATAGVLVACGGGTDSRNITLAPKVFVDRFSDVAGHLFKRSSNTSLPAANAPIALDSGPFITNGLNKNGAKATYYNFDVQTTSPDDIYVFFTADAKPVVGQNNVLASIPGDSDYNDFWRVNKVTVPAGYVPNSIQSESAVRSSGFAVLQTNTIVNCPVVPFGSSALRSKVAGVPSTLSLGWYKDQAVGYFSFEESPLMLTSDNKIPVDDIYVTFNVNPSSNAGSGPASGFKLEPGTTQTHNVIASSPGDADYSPLWAVSFIDNAKFLEIGNLEKALAASPQPAGVNVNCPVVL